MECDEFLHLKQTQQRKSSFGPMGDSFPIWL